MKYYYITAFIQGRQQYLIYDGKLDSAHDNTFMFDLKVFSTESGAKKWLDKVKQDYGITDGGRNTALIKSGTLQSNMEIKGNRIKFKH